MLIFGNDDSDDLELDFERKASLPSNNPPKSSLPKRPVTRSPFGSSSDQIENLETEKKATLPSRPTSPFGQPTTSSRLPQKPPLETKRPLPPIPVKQASKPHLPVSKPLDSESQNSDTQSGKFSPDITSYFPAQQVETPEEEQVATTEVLSESELYLKDMKEKAEERAREARKEQAIQEAKPVPNVVAPRLTVSKDTNNTVEQSPEIETVDSPKTKKNKQGFLTSPKKGNKKAVANKPSRENKYEGERKKILYIRLVAGSVAAVIIIAGLQAIFLPSSGPTKEQVQSAAKQAVNYTGFPTASGEQFSLDFAKAYFNFDSTDKARADSLARFASPDLVKQIDVAIMSSQEYASIKKVDQSSYSNYTVAQSISYGPYVVATNNITDKNALFTVKVGLKTGSVVYLDVPVKYDPTNFSMTLAGPPSFSKPIQNQGTATKDEWTSTFDGGGDDTVQKSFQPDLEAYLSAWALSDSTIINRYILDSATDNAKRGLQKAVKFNKIIDLKVEPLNKDKPSTETSRRVEFNVLWEDPVSGLRYPQQYRMLIGLNQDKKWAIYDIENFAVLN